MPPLAAGIGLPWDVAVADPITALAAARAELGDTFVAVSYTHLTLPTTPYV